MAENKKVFVLGLDGGTFNVIKPLIKAGKLPNLAKIMRGGVHAYLDSTIPPLTPVAWPSMFTGKLPGKHGVFDFQLLTKIFNQEKCEPEKKMVNSTFIQSKSLWELLSEAEKKCIVVDVPLTYPPSKINGLMISRVMAGQKMKVTYPKELYYKLTRKKLLHKKSTKDNLANEHAELDDEAKAIKEKLDQQKTFENLIDSIDHKLELVKYLSPNYAWDFFKVVFMESDQVGHGLWVDQEKVEAVYQKLDKVIGEILSLLPDNCAKFIVSDHGFKGIKGYFSLDEWLFRRGYLKKTFDLDKKNNKILKNLDKFKEDFHKNPGEHMGSLKFRTKLDYKKSLAYLYSGTSYGIRINLQGRDPMGVVPPSEYLSFRNKLMLELRGIKDPQTGKGLFDVVLKKEAVIGKTVDDHAACDIYLLPTNMDYCLGSFNKENGLFHLKAGGFHRREGIFFAWGEDFKKGFDAKKISILDVTPTILHLMGVPVPRDVDGRVRKEMFNKVSDGYQREVVFGKGSQKLTREKKTGKIEEKKINRQLKALGYVG